MVPGGGGGRASERAGGLLICRLSWRPGVWVCGQLGWRVSGRVVLSRCRFLSWCPYRPVWRLWLLLARSIQARWSAWSELLRFNFGRFRASGVTEAPFRSSPHQTPAAQVDCVASRWLSSASLVSGASLVSDASLEWNAAVFV